MITISERKGNTMTARELHAVNSSVKETYKDNLTGQTLCKLDYTTNGADSFPEEWEKYSQLEDREVVGIYTFTDGEYACIGCYLF